MKSLNNRPPIRIAVIGAAECSTRIAELAYETGRLIAASGAILITGGRSGVMEAASKGALEAGGLTVGILPGADPLDANPFVTVPIATGLGHARNAVIAQCADAIIAVSGGYGTLSEIAMGLKMKKPVFGIETLTTIEGLIPVPTPEEAIRRIFKT